MRTQLSARSRQPCLPKCPAENSFCVCREEVQKIRASPQGDKGPTSAWRGREVPSVARLKKAGLVPQSILTPSDPMDCTLPGSSLMDRAFSGQESLRGLSCTSPRDLPDPGIEPRSPRLQAVSLPSEPRGRPG